MFFLITKHQQLKSFEKKLFSLLFVSLCFDDAPHWTVWSAHETVISQPSVGGELLLS